MTHLGRIIYRRAINRAVMKERQRCLKAVTTGPYPVLMEVIVERIEKP